MTVCNIDAVSSKPVNWDSINWDSMNRLVLKLQMRIAKATRENRWRKVKSLQWLLTHSFSGKALAIRKVTTNRGKRTPGVDGVLLKTPDSKISMINSLKRRGYSPQPLRRIYIPKSNGKMRPLGIPTMKDRAMQSLHALALLPVSESQADWNSYGFRPERCTMDANQALFFYLSQKKGPQWVLEGDIKGCFDNISHEWMSRNICTDNIILAKWLSSGYIEKKRLFPTLSGTPQGGAISPMLANIVLDGIEDLLDHHYGLRRFNGKMKRSRIGQVRFVRYADDFIVTGESRELLEMEVQQMIQAFLKERGLTLSEDKTKITHISEGFTFLGQTMRKYNFGKRNVKFLTKPSKSSIKNILTKIRGTIKSMRANSQEELILRLNPIITGWANYHKGIVAKRTFNKLDYQIWNALWLWAESRHDGKNRTWICNRYFHKVKGVSRAFSCIKKNAEKKSLIVLATASEIKIRRHVKIKGEAQPFDPCFFQYFQERIVWKWVSSKQGKVKVMALYKKQKGLCMQCGERISSVTGWRLQLKQMQYPNKKVNLSDWGLYHPQCTAKEAYRFTEKLPAELLQ